MPLFLSVTAAGIRRKTCVRMRCAHASWADETTKQIGLASRTRQSLSWSGCDRRMRPDKTKSPLRQPRSRTTTRIERASASLAGFQGAVAGPRRLGSENPTGWDFVGRWGCGRTLNCILFLGVTTPAAYVRVCIRTHDVVFLIRIYPYLHWHCLVTRAAQEPPCTRPSPEMWMHS